MPSAASVTFGLVVGWCCVLVAGRSWRSGAARKLRAGVFVALFTLGAATVAALFAGRRQGLIVLAGIALGAATARGAARQVSRRGR